MALTLRQYIAEDPRQLYQLAIDLGTHHAYLWQIANGWRGRRPSGAMARRIEVATGGKVRKETMRPDLFPPARAA